eukprot:3272298-Rhodomonas_salina.2
MKLWDYLSTHSSQVELVRKDRDSGLALVERVYFRVTPEPYTMSRTERGSGALPVVVLRHPVLRLGRSLSGVAVDRRERFRGERSHLLLLLRDVRY